MLPVALVAAFVVLLVANLHLSCGWSRRGEPWRRMWMALLVGTALAFSRKPAAAVIVALLAVDGLSLDPGVFDKLGR